MPTQWTNNEDRVLIEHLELGYQLDDVAHCLNISVLEVERRVIRLFRQGDIVLISADVFDAMLK
jgi:hypothetical protein